MKLQKLWSLWKSDCIIPISQVWVRSDLMTSIFDLFVWMHEISTFIIFNNVVANPLKYKKLFLCHSRRNIFFSPYWFYIGVWPKNVFQKIFKWTQTERKTTCISCKKIIKCAQNRNILFVNLLLINIHPCHATLQLAMNYSDFSWHGIISCPQKS